MLLCSKILFLYGAVDDEDPGEKLKALLALKSRDA